MDFIDFLNDLHHHNGDNTGRHEIRIKNDSGPMVSRIFSNNPEVIRDTVTASQQKKSDRNAVYFGVAKRRRGAKEGKKKDVSSVSALWADVDTVKMGWDTKATIRRLYELPYPLRPSICVMSGGGLHLYWLLKEPVVFDTFGTDLWHSQVREFEEVNKLVQTVMTSDAVHDITRVLRLPSTWNTKAVRVDDEHASNALKYATKVEVVWNHWFAAHTMQEYADAFGDKGEFDMRGVPQKVLGPEGFIHPKDMPVPDEHTVKGNYEKALRSALGEKKGERIAGWEEIWSRCRYHNNSWPYLGVDEAIVRSTARLWCIKENELKPDAIVDSVMRKLKLIQSEQAPDERWDWVEEREKVSKQLHRWIEQWELIRENEKKIRAAKRRAEKAAKAGK